MLEAKKVILVDALKRHKGNLMATCKELGISYRTIHRNCEAWGIDVEEIRGWTRKEQTGACAP